jgi:hypothetical protein
MKPVDRAGDGGRVVEVDGRLTASPSTTRPERKRNAGDATNGGASGGYTSVVPAVASDALAHPVWTKEATKAARARTNTLTAIIVTGH